jgi:hypothetical protein
VIRSFLPLVCVAVVAPAVAVAQLPAGCTPVVYHHPAGQPQFAPAAPVVVHPAGVIVGRWVPPTPQPWYPAVPQSVPQPMPGPLVSYPVQRGTVLPYTPLPNLQHYLMPAPRCGPTGCPAR